MVVVNVGFVPQYLDSLGNDELFEFEGYDPTDAYGADRIGFKAAADRLCDEGHRVRTVDVCDVRSLDVCVFVDMNFDYLDRLLSLPDPPRLVYVQREPPSVRWYNTAARLPRYASAFDAVLTWNGDLARSIDRAAEYNIPQYLDPVRGSPPPFEDRKLLVNVSSRKYSNHPEELYSAREDVVQYYDRNYSDEFSLYGRYWNQRPRPEVVYHHHVVNPPVYRTYRGLIEEKSRAYRNHRFALCFENMTGIAGYVTEKLFDCLRAGVVPVYWGADDIESYVPSEAFVDYREFGTPESLHEYLVSVSESEHREYVETARAFLESTASDRVTPGQYAGTVYDAVTGESTARTVPSDLREEISARGLVARLEDAPETLPPHRRVGGVVCAAARHPELVVANPSSVLNPLRSLV